MENELKKKKPDSLNISHTAASHDSVFTVLKCENELWNMK